MIKQYSTEESLAAAGKPTNESLVAQVMSTNRIVTEGVNVIKDTAQIGDAVYKSTDGKVYIIDGNSLNVALIPATWVYQGPFLYMYDKYTIAHFNGNMSSLPTKKYADFVQFSISAITATSITFYLKMAGDYVNFVQIDVTLTSATIDATSASEITAALESAGNTGNVGYAKHKYWAYLADANGNKVDSNGTQIIVQCDNWFDYRQYQCSDSTHSLVGCTMTHVTWGDMPAKDFYLKSNGRGTSARGIINIKGGVEYWSANGRTPNANVVVYGEAGNTDPMSKSAYQTSAYAAAIREYYPTYKDYIRGEFGIMNPHSGYGVFALPNGKDMTEKYGKMTAVTKDGTSKAKFPALNWAYALGNNSHLWDVREGVLIMLDENLAAINVTQTKNGKVTISNAAFRWFAERYGMNYAWLFNGTSRNLYTNTVNSAHQVGAVTLLKIK